MNLEFPKFVFRAGGAYGIPGAKYDMLLTHSKEEYEITLKNKWFATVTEALSKDDSLDELVGVEEIKKDIEKPKVTRQRKEV